MAYGAIVCDVCGMHVTVTRERQLFRSRFNI